MVVSESHASQMGQGTSELAADAADATSAGVATAAKAKFAVTAMAASTFYSRLHLCEGQETWAMLNCGITSHSVSQCVEALGGKNCCASPLSEVNEPWPWPPWTLLDPQQRDPQSALARPRPPSVNQSVDQAEIRWLEKCSWLREWNNCMSSSSLLQREDQQSSLWHRWRWAQGPWWQQHWRSSCFHGFNPLCFMTETEWKVLDLFLV